MDPQQFSPLAAAMSADENITIFRQFEELNILNLLVLQDEIYKLNESFRLLCPKTNDNTDTVPPGYLASYVVGHKAEIQREQQDEAQRTARLKMWNTLQDKLRTYSESLNHKF